MAATLPAGWRLPAQGGLLLAGVVVVSLCVAWLQSGDGSGLLYFDGSFSPLAAVAGCLSLTPWACFTFLYGPAPRRLQFAPVALFGLLGVPLTWLITWVLSGAWQTTGLYDWMASLATGVQLVQTLPNGEERVLDTVADSLGAHGTVLASWFAASTFMAVLPSIKTPCPSCGAPHTVFPAGQLPAASTEPAPTTPAEAKARQVADAEVQQLSIGMLREVVHELHEDRERGLRAWSKLVPLLTEHYHELRYRYVVTLWSCTLCAAEGLRGTRAPGASVDLEERLPQGTTHAMTAAVGERSS